LEEARNLIKDDWYAVYLDVKDDKTLGVIDDCEEGEDCY